MSLNAADTRAQLIDPRLNIVGWTRSQAEERLVTVLSQLIEQKFRRLSYKELSQMLRLTPLRETVNPHPLGDYQCRELRTLD